MPVSELGSSLVTPFDPRRRAPERRSPREPLAQRPPEEAAVTPPSPEPVFLAPVVVPDLSRLTTLHDPPPDLQGPRAEANFYAHLNRLVAAIRDGDLARARALVETLETEMLVERSAGQAPALRRGGEGVRPARGAAPPQAVEAIYETLAHYLVTDAMTS